MKVSRSKPGAPRTKQGALYTPRLQPHPKMPPATTWDAGSYEQENQNNLILAGLTEIVGGNRNVLPVLNTVGVMGGVNLIGSSTRRLVTSKTVEDKLDASSDLLWGAQVGLQAPLLINQLPTSSTLEPILHLADTSSLGHTSAVLGTVGAGLQAFAGGIKTYKGVKLGNQILRTRGVLETAAGACWMLSALGIATPFSAAGFIGFTLASRIYAKSQQSAPLNLTNLQEAARELNHILTPDPMPTEKEEPIHFASWSHQRQHSSVTKPVNPLEPYLNALPGSKNKGRPSSKTASPSIRPNTGRSAQIRTADL